MNNRYRQVVIVLLVVVAVIGLVLNLAGLAAVWMINQPLTEFGVQLLSAAQTTALAVENVLPPIEQGLEQIRQPVAAIADATAELAQSTAEQGLVLQLLPESLSERLVDGLAQVQEFYDALVAALTSLNQTLEALNALPLVSVPTLADTDLPERLATLESGVGSLRSTVVEARTQASGRIEELSDQAQATSAMIADWQQTLETTRERLENIQERLAYYAEQLPLWINLAALALTLLVLAGILSQAAVLTLARSLYKNARLQLQPGMVLGEVPVVSPPGDPAL